MAILTFGELIAWAQTNCPEEYARLPDPDIYKITCINACVKVCIGIIARTAVYQDLISFENNVLKVTVHLDYNTGALILLAGDNMRLTPSFYSQIQLTEPFCWIWPSLSASLGLAKFNALVRYVLMARGHDGRLADMSFGIQEVFPQICADIARGQDVKNMKSMWEAGQRTDQELRDDHSKSEDENDLGDAHSTKESLEGQQKRGVTFDDRMQYLSEEFEIFKSTLQADYEDYLEEKAKQGAVVKGLKDDIAAAKQMVHNLEVQLEDAQNEVVMWKLKYDKLRGIMRGAIDEQE